MLPYVGVTCLRLPYIIFMTWLHFTPYVQVRIGTILPEFTSLIKMPYASYCFLMLVDKSSLFLTRWACALSARHAISFQTFRPVTPLHTTFRQRSIFLEIRVLGFSATALLCFYFGSQRHEKTKAPNLCRYVTYAMLSDVGFFIFLSNFVFLKFLFFCYLI